MPSTRQIRGRIRVAKNIQQITKAMKMVAAARLKRAQDRVVAARPYATKTREVMTSLNSAGGASLSHPLLEAREPVRIGVLIISADRGLCGSYATNVIRRTNETIRSLNPQNVKMIIVGRKGVAFYRRRGYEVVGEYNLNMTGVKFTEAQIIGQQVRKMFASGEVDVVHLVYTRFLSALTQRPTDLQLLPLATDEMAGTSNVDAKDANETTDDYLFDPDANSILERLLPHYIDTVIYQAMIEAVASEHGARMTAMSSATDNAGKMITSLTLILNRARQANITKEIAEIVGGAEALK